MSNVVRFSLHYLYWQTSLIYNLTLQPPRLHLTMNYAIFSLDCRCNDKNRFQFLFILKQDLFDEIFLKTLWLTIQLFSKL